ncbi:MAG: hypothetical protein IJR59_05045 [Firmicutes bacterium]|nr:hypothetical protein [Bacillota bacterium]
MKKLFYVLIIFVLLISLSACGSLPKADYDSPDAVIDAALAQHPIKEGDIYDIYDELEGKTFRVKTNLYKENDISVVYQGSYGSNTIDVDLAGIYDESGKPLTDFDYKKGDTIVLKVAFVSFRGTKSGNLRQYFIMAELPD